MVLFLYAAQATGQAALMEHPATAWWAPEAPSSWMLPELKAHEELPGVVAQYFDQCMAGARSRKPTQLRSVNLPSLSAHIDLLAGGGLCDRSHTHVTLKGKDRDGVHLTVPAKMYPPTLCRIFAAAFFDYAVDRLGHLETDGQVDIPAGIESFYVPLDPFFDFEMQHDCAKQSRPQLDDVNDDDLQLYRQLYPRVFA